MDKATVFNVGAFMWKVEKIVSKGDYNYCVVKEHPNSSKYGYVLHHRIVMENHLGRLLNSNEVVHHKNENKKDNRIKNLELMDYREHVKIHSTKGRTMITLKCPECKTIFDRERRNTFLINKTTYTCCSNSCRGKFSRKIQLQGKTHEVEMAISENLVREFNSLDNSEETVTTGSVEAIRHPPETVKIWSSQQAS